MADDDGELAAPRRRPGSGTALVALARVDPARRAGRTAGLASRVPSAGAPPMPAAPPLPTAPAWAVTGADDPDAEPERMWVRPYFRTRGRTRARTDLAIETLVSMIPGAPRVTDAEQAAIAAVCAAPRSVAEVAARLAVPLGVARVLIDDMAFGGVLRVHPRPVPGSGPPPPAVLRRVLDGLHRL
jgi:hypothetical protein